MATPGRIVGALVVFVLAVSAKSTARDIRPSDHGIEYQPNAPPPGKKSPPEMRSFFGPSPSDRRNVAFPKAVNSSEPLWINAGRHGGDGKVRKVLLVASVVGGVAGVGLLVASTLLYLFKFRNQKSQCTNDIAN